MSDNSLASFIESVTGDSRFAIEENLGDGFVRLKVAEAERRQAKHDIRSVEDICIEMLRNARDAHARRVYVAISRADSIKKLVFVDDGDGIPEALVEKVFEPRVTSKLESMVMDRWGVHGRGMALYSVRQNTVETRVVDTVEGGGTSIAVSVDLNELSEKKDQSTFPTLGKDEDGNMIVARGPHNVVRCIVEFALEHEGSIEVFLGTPTTVSAMLAVDGKRRLSDDELLFVENLHELPICLRPAAASDAGELMDACASIGLEIGERTAHRILAGRIDPAEQPLEKVRGASGAPAEKAVDIYRDSRGLKISKSDLSRFSRILEKSFDEIAEGYYIQLADEPKITVGKDTITVKFKIEKDL